MLLPTEERAGETVSAPERTRTQSTFDDDLLWTRLCLYVKVLFLIHAGLVSVTTVQWMIGAPSAAGPTVTPFRLLTSWSLTGFLGFDWWYLARRRPARWVLCVGDAIIPLALAGIYLGLLLMDNRQMIHAGLILLTLVSLALVLRAALVPSTVRRTVIVGALAVGSALAGSLILASAAEPFDHLWVGVLGAAFITVTVVTSSVIYGLRKQVRDAQRLGQYRLKRKIGEGGMGVVYEATHILLQRPTAVKLLPTEKAGKEAVARFEREVRYTCRLEHPNCVAIYDYGRTPDGQFYYAMEYLGGFDLDVLVHRYGPMNDARTASVLLQAAHALAEAHDNDLVHRDIKPGNIRLCDRGGVPDMVKVLDFGLVKPIHADGPGDSLAAMVTQAGTFIGTPQYLAPEAIRGISPVGPATDVYALGAVGWFLLTGREVFEGASAVEICAQHLTAEPQPPSKVSRMAVNVELENILLRCLAKDPAERFRSGRELSAALAHLRLDGWSWKQAREWWDNHSPASQSEKAELLTERTQLDIDVQARHAP